MSYAFKPSGGDWIEITAAGTRLPGAGEFGEDVVLSDAFVASLPPEVRVARSLVEIVETEPPAGERVLGRGLVDAGGVPTRTWETEPYALAELKTAALVAARAAYSAARQSPMPWDFGAIAALDDLGGAAGAAGVQTLQMRDDGLADDLKNWLAVAQGADLADRAGAGAMLQPIKTTANVWVQTTAAQVLQVLVSGDGVQVSALQRGMAMLARFGEIKATIEGAADAEALAAIDVTSGYPD